MFDDPKVSCKIHKCNILSFRVKLIPERGAGFGARNVESRNGIWRNLPQLPDFVVSLDFPLMRVAGDLNPDALRRPQSKNKVCSDKEFLDLAVGHRGQTFTKVIQEAEAQLGMSRRTAMSYLKRLTGAGLVVTSGGLYWRKNAEGQEGNIP